MNYVITRTRAAFMDYFKGCPASIREAMDALELGHRGHADEAVEWAVNAGFIRRIGKRPYYGRAGYPPELYQTTTKGNAALNLTYEVLEKQASVIVTETDIELMQRSLAA